jgi:hypothetical protein
MMRKLIMSIVVLLILAVAIAVSALTYDSSKVMAISWKSSNGGWFACGPVQCTSVSNDSEDEALGFVKGYKHGPWKYIGSYGKCDVYQGSDGPNAGDHNANWIESKATTKCAY